MRERGRVTVLDCVRDAEREDRREIKKLGESEDQQQGFCLTASERLGLSDPSRLIRLVACAGSQTLRRTPPSQPAHSAPSKNYAALLNAVSISWQHD